MRVSMPQAMAAGAAALVVALLTACGGEPRYTQISAVGDHTCGLRTDGSVVCWGADDYGQLRAPADERFTAVAAGGVHTCGLRTDGTTVCWGYRLPSGEYLSELRGPNRRPPFPPEDERLTAIEAGADYTCGFRTDDGVVCWDTRTDFSPFGTEEVVQISSGGTHVCGLRSDGSVLCHGWLAPPRGRAVRCHQHRDCSWLWAAPEQQRSLLGNRYRGPTVSARGRAVFIDSRRNLPYLWAADGWVGRLLGQRS